MDYGIYCFIKFQHNSETLLEIASMFIVKHFDCVMYEYLLAQRLYEGVVDKTTKLFDNLIVAI